jgi:diguanylate cyclase (GGDEF)-like protein
VCHVLRTCTRENVDFLFRYGGDEFSFILTQTNIDQASKVAERILTTYRDQEFDIGETSISIGLVQCDPEDNRSWQENSSVLIEKADQALYKAKNNGRNQVCIWSNIQA